MERSFWKRALTSHWKIFGMGNNERGQICRHLKETTCIPVMLLFPTRYLQIFIDVFILQVLGAAWKAKAFVCKNSNRNVLVEPVPRSAGSLKLEQLIQFK